MKYFIWIITMSLLLIPGVYLSFLPEKIAGINYSELSGGFLPADPPEFFPDLLFSGEYAASMQDYIQDQHPRRGWFVRLHNQIDYSVFGHSSNQRIEVGQEGELYDRTYIDAWLGNDAISVDSVNRLISSLGRLQDSLAAYQTKLLVLTPPGKPTFMPEKLPHHFLRMKRDATNRTRISSALEAHHINYIDFSYLTRLQDNIPYRLYPRAGLHWSLYGAAIAADSVLSRMADLLQISPVRMTYSPEPYYDRMQTDFEVERAMNLMFPISRNELVRPVFRFIEDSLTTRPKVIVVGDSYYKVWYDQGLQEQLFHPESQFWYYGRAILPEKEIGGERIAVPSLNVQEEIRKADLIILVNAEINLPRLGFGLVERMSGE